MSGDWASYDSAAQSHDRLAVPAIFAAPAADLVDRLDVQSASAILDAGSGTGIAARIAAQRASVGTIVVALDPSLEMVKVARARNLRCAVQGTLPGLPFRDAAFDCVMASFVLSHVPSYRDALLDMVRVLRPRGRLGVTAWSSLENEFRDYWDSLAEAAVGKDALQRANQQALPWEDYFLDGANLAAALHDAGLFHTEVDHTRYPVRMSIADFLAVREDSIAARFVRRTLPPERWEDFKQRTRASFRQKFADPLEHTREANIAIGRR